ncbi:MAG: peptidoglycan glycosyltransferase, partial [Lachnospiraceae bacterium]|nr:peptidoglycan glycosyltransferase [Lachnospiraceae bacterium]
MRGRKKKTSVKKLTRRMQGTLLFVFCVILAGVIVIGGRLIYINAKEGERYEKRVLSKSIGTNASLPYRRGDILDRNGVVLAKSVKVYNVIFDPSVVNSDKRYAEPTVAALVSVYGLDERELYTMLTEKASSSYIRLLRRQSFEMMDAFRKLASENKLIKGVWFEEEYIRSYPCDSLASHVIGYPGAGDVGPWGIEQYY